MYFLNKSLKTNDKQGKLAATYMAGRVNISNRFYTSKKQRGGKVMGGANVMIKQFTK